MCLHELGSVNIRPPNTIPSFLLRNIKSLELITRRANTVLGLVCAGPVLSLSRHMYLKQLTTWGVAVEIVVCATIVRMQLTIPILL